MPEEGKWGAQSRRRRMLPWLVAAWLLLGVAGSVFLLLGTRPRVDGAFRATGAASGDWAWQPDSCGAGGRQGFAGVSLLRGSDARLRVLADAGAGPGISLSASGGASQDWVTWSASQCKTLDVSLGRERTRGGWGLWNGSVTVECPLPDGGVLEGHAEFRRCG